MKLIQAITCIALLGCNTVTTQPVKRLPNGMGLYFDIELTSHTSIQKHDKDNKLFEPLVKFREEYDKRFGLRERFSWASENVGKNNDNSKQYFEFIAYTKNDEVDYKYQCWLQAIKSSEDIHEYTLKHTGDHLQSINANDEARLYCKDEDNEGNTIDTNRFLFHW